MSKFINNFKNFFSKKTNKQEVSDKINFDEIRSTLKDSLTSVKDLGFDIKMINYSFEPITLRNLSLEIIIRPNTGNYDFSEFMSELQNSISHIEYSEMDVKMDFSVNFSNISLPPHNSRLRNIIKILYDIFDLDKNTTIFKYLSKIENFKNFITHPDVVLAFESVGDFNSIGDLKSSISIKLEITGEYESNNI
jgi:hypothetical protein